MVYRGIHFFFLFLLKNIDYGYSLEPPRRGGSNEYHLCFEQKYEKYRTFLSENFQFLQVNFSIYLNRRVFVMKNEWLTEILQADRFFDLLNLSWMKKKMSILGEDGAFNNSFKMNYNGPLTVKM